MQALASFLCGLIFGAGLMISGMTQPAKVLGFLDIFGRWDPTLAFVMAGALAVSSMGYILARRQRRPVITALYFWPSRTDIDRPLIVGSVLFGIGWGLAGLCPGPALVNLASLAPRVFAFVVAMIAGMSVLDLWQRRVPSASAIENAALANSDGQPKALTNNVNGLRQLLASLSHRKSIRVTNGVTTSPNPESSATNDH
jgi:hypothetical protein